VFQVLLAVSISLSCAQKGSSEPLLDSDQLHRLLRSAFEPFRDVTFVYEGSVKALGDASDGHNYQGSYSFRHDGATSLDVIEQPLRADRPLTNTIHFLFREKYYGRTKILDTITTDPVVSTGGPGALNRPNSPERFLLLWFLQTLETPADYSYECLGWERVRDRTCLKIKLDSCKNLAFDMKWFFILWLDVERGCHPLKVEFRHNGDLRYVTDDIVLTNVEAAEGVEVWLPTRAKTTTYSKGSPAYVESYSVVNGSIQLNRNMGDEQFSAKARHDVAGTPEMQSLRAKIGREPSRRTDPGAVRQRLESALASADRQAGRLEASSSLRADWNWTLVVQSFFVLLGSSIVVATLVLRVKGKI